MIRILIALFELILIIGAAYGLSFIFNKKYFIFSTLDHIIFRIVLGLGIISLITFFLSILHQLNIYSFIIVLFIGNILLIKNFELLRNIKFEINISIWGYIILIFFIFNLFYSLFPPTFYDSMMYHLAVPNYYLINDGMVSWNTNFSSNFPLNVEMIFLFSLLGKTVLIPKLISLVSGILILLLIFSWTSGKKMKFTFFLPLILFYTIPQVGFLSSSSKTDLTGMLFVFSAIKVYFYYVKNNKIQYLILSGVFLGFAIGSKYIFGFYMIGFFIAILFMQGMELKKKISSILIISVIVIILMIPWLIKNIIITGNPIYPYLNSFFKSNFWSDAQSAGFSSGIHRGDSHSLLKYIYYPLELFLKPYSYGITAVYGVLLLLFFPFILFSEKEKHIRTLIISGISSFILIMPFALVPRYFLMSFLLLTIPVASGVSNSLKKFKIIKKYLIFIAGFLLIINLIMQISLQEKIFQGFSYLKVKLLNKNNEQISYLYTLPYYRAFEFLNNNLSDNEKVLFLGEDRSFYLTKQFYLSSFNDNNKIIELIKTKDNPEKILQRLKEQKYSHILFSDIGLERMSKMSVVYKLSEDHKKKLLFFLSNLKIIYNDRLYKIFKI